MSEVLFYISHILKHCTIFSIHNMFCELYDWFSVRFWILNHHSGELYLSVTYSDINQMFHYLSFALEYESFLSGGLDPFYLFITLFFLWNSVIHSRQHTLWFWISVAGLFSLQRSRRTLVPVNISFLHLTPCSFLLFLPHSPSTCSLFGNASSFV